MELVCVGLVISQAGGTTIGRQQWPQTVLKMLNATDFEGHFAFIISHLVRVTSRNFGLEPVNANDRT